VYLPEAYIMGCGHGPNARHRSPPP
jgi:hypothetical protein